MRESAVVGRSWRSNATPTSLERRAEISGQALTQCSTMQVDVASMWLMAWAIDRLGQLRIDLLGTIQHLEAVGVDLYLEQQHLGTTTPTGSSSTSLEHSASSSAA